MYIIVFKKSESHTDKIFFQTTQIIELTCVQN